MTVVSIGERAIGLDQASARPNTAEVMQPSKATIVIFIGVEYTNRLSAALRFRFDCVNIFRLFELRQRLTRLAIDGRHRSAVAEPYRRRDQRHRQYCCGATLIRLSRARSAASVPLRWGGEDHG